MRGGNCKDIERGKVCLLVQAQGRPCEGLQRHSGAELWVGVDALQDHHLVIHLHVAQKTFLKAESSSSRSPYLNMHLSASHALQQGHAELDTSTP